MPGGPFAAADCNACIEQGGQSQGRRPHQSACRGGALDAPVAHPDSRTGSARRSDGDPMSEFFLSYARADRALAEAVVQLCAAAGHAFWWDSKLIPGIFFRSVINRRIENAGAVVVIWTQRSAVSPWVVAEAQHAHSLMKLVNICGPGFSSEKIPKPFFVYNILQWSDLPLLPQVLGRGYFGVHAEPGEFARRADSSPLDIPFLDILDDLYFHYATAVRGDMETVQNYLRRFPEGRHTAEASRELARLSAMAVVTTVEAQLPAGLEDSAHRVIELLRGVRHDGQPFWAYVAIMPSRHRRYTEAKANSRIDLHQFSEWGEVVSAGVAEWPGHADNAHVAALFNIDPGMLFDPSAVAVAMSKRGEPGAYPTDFSARGAEYLW